MKKPIANLLAILISPLAVLPLALPLLLDSSIRSYAQEFFTSALIVSYIATLLIGLPSHLTLRYFDRKSLLEYLSVGFLLTVIVLISIPIIHGDFHDFKGKAYLFISAIGLLGAGVAGSYWWVYKLARKKK